MRIGVGHPGESHEVTGHVLKRPQADEQKALDEALQDAISALPVLLDDGLEKAQQQLHSLRTTPKPYRKAQRTQGDDSEQKADDKDGD